MLGPALFKIRFPFFSQEDFLEKIVPSIVLSKDEVIAINHFKSLPNRRGISDGLIPMPFPTNERISDQKEGTLLMDIEKLSEFGREIDGSSRYSEKVYINRLPWKIWAQIMTKWRRSTDDDVEKCFGIFLLCTAPKQENWSCKCSGIIRIVSQKNGVTDLRREFDTHVKNNENNGWGYVNFIALSQLMDPEKGFYNKSEDKVTLAIDVTVKEAKREDKAVNLL